jgi:hypothetical protein
MQFIVYSIGQNSQEPPTPQLMEEMGKFMAEAMQAGVIVTTGGVSATGTRLKLDNGKYTVTDGPYIEAKELTGGFAVIQVASKEEAIEWSKRFLAVLGEGESEIVPIYGPA